MGCPTRLTGNSFYATIHRTKSVQHVTTRIKQRRLIVNTSTTTGVIGTIRGVKVRVVFPRQRLHFWEKWNPPNMVATPIPIFTHYTIATIVIFIIITTNILVVALPIDTRAPYPRIHPGNAITTSVV